jgi:hypothetical protein
MAALWFLTCLPAISQQVDGYFPAEDFVLINPTLPDSKLDFNDDSKDSCCAKDYTPSGVPISTGGRQEQSANAQTTAKTLANSAFEHSNPRYIENTAPSYLVACDRFADLPQQASNSVSPPMPGEFSSRSGKNNLPIAAYSTNISNRVGAEYFTDPRLRNTSAFHIETAGGESMVKLQDVNSYSVCMGRGGNVAMVANTDSGSIITYNGNDHIYLSGNNTNMLTRTGDGEDTIELYQAQPHGSGDFRTETWTAYNIYKTALSGGTGTDSLVIKGTPYGTKWCHIGGYKIYGEYFYVIELALPPTVTEGPRRQRINIGQSIEYVVIKGKRYKLNEFLVHGEPVDTVARSVPPGDALPHVSWQARPEQGG